VSDIKEIRRILGVVFLVLVGVLILPGPLVAQVPSPEEMWRIIQDQQKTIEDLKARLDQTDRSVEQNISALELTADAVESVTMRSDQTRLSGTAVGGYGELHYNNLSDDVTADGNDSLDRTDFHRFVLFVSHEFSENIRFFSELELEHSLAGEGEPGEVELEQAWLEMDLNDRHRVRAGLDILPLGIINPTHEPNTFYGVERNRVESEIIPATWWEAGLGVNGELAPGWNYDLVVHNGLAVPTTGGSAFRPRSGRSKVAQADDLALATTARIRYTAIPGLELSLAGQYQDDITGTADDIDIGATLLESHVIWQHRSGLGLRALYARWDLGDDTGLDPMVFNASSLSGWYIEPSYRFRMGSGRWGDLGLFARYSSWDERNQLTGAHRFEDFEQFTAGLNWWPHDNVVIKFDAQWQDANGQVDRSLDGINLGLGYQF
jgi:hypothetical protein